MMSIEIANEVLGNASLVEDCQLLNWSKSLRLEKHAEDDTYCGFGHHNRHRKC